ncbi:hypothetical protein [Carnobacterium maltaromaticum]|uniref:hypothetical protein n=1 Tax=Carnobacterium maltaromaticum TaxID=2751 RepID=UPI0039B00B34
MTKIDESKQYKFSEIIAMLENEELPNETNISSGTESFIVLKCMLGTFGLASNKDDSFVKAHITPTDINSYWSIELPKEDKFYLKAPDCFTGFLFLKHNKNIQKYYTSDKYEDAFTQVKFTQKEIDSMPFDTKFFEKIKVEQSDE